MEIYFYQNSFLNPCLESVLPAFELGLVKLSASFFDSFVLLLALAAPCIFVPVVGTDQVCIEADLRVHIPS